MFCPLKYRHDVSFWTDEASFSEAALRAFVARVFRRCAALALAATLQRGKLQRSEADHDGGGGGGEVTVDHDQHRFDDDGDDFGGGSGGGGGGDEAEQEEAEGSVVSFTLEQFDAYTCPKTQRTSRGYHVDLWCGGAALTKPASNALMKQVSKRLCGEAGFKGGASSRYRFDLLPVSRGGDLQP